MHIDGDVNKVIPHARLVLLLLRKETERGDWAPVEEL